MGGLFSKDSKRNQKRKSTPRNNKTLKERPKPKPKPKLDESLVKIIELDESHISETNSQKSIHSTIPQVPAHPTPFLHLEPLENDEFIDIEVADPEAFNLVFIEQRESAINNELYSKIIDRWQPTTLEQLIDLIRDLGQGKSLIDRHWIIYHWITGNIEYDVVNYFAKNYQDQSAEGVFRRRLGVCAGYGNLYKHICDRLEMPCEAVGGYSKGYGFDDRESAQPEIDHAWNVVKIYHYWYLVESTWGAGSLTEEKTFKQHRNPYYFLPRPDEMIYHHLPEEEKWQLLRQPIPLKQFAAMPKLRPEYFQYGVELIQPKNQAFITFQKNQGYGLIVLKVPKDVELIADLKLNDKVVEGGDQVIFDKRNQIYSCYFAPQTIGKHKAYVYAKYKSAAENQLFNAVIDLTFKVESLSENRISYPKTWSQFFDFRMEIISPQKTHLIKLDGQQKFAEILIGTPPDIELLGMLKSSAEEISYSTMCFFDSEQNYWRCRFAPNSEAIFDATIMAKRISDPTSYTSAVAFKIDSTHLSRPLISFPKTWTIFHDLQMKIVKPQNRGIILIEPSKTTLVEIHIKSSNDISLMGQLQTIGGELLENTSNFRFDREKNRWICQFAPPRKGIFTALILAKRQIDSGLYTSAVEFRIKTKKGEFKPVSLLKKTQLFYDFGLEVLSSTDDNTIVLPEDSSYVEIKIKAPDHVELLTQLNDRNGRALTDSIRTHYDERKLIWTCQFAPNGRGEFSAIIFGKEKSQSDVYNEVLSYKILVRHEIYSPATFPRFFPKFDEYQLQIESPKLTKEAQWFPDLSYAQILLRAPTHIALLGSMSPDDDEFSVFTQFDHRKKLWQFFFAPKTCTDHQLTIFAKRIDLDEPNFSSVVSFSLSVDEILHRIEFPLTFSKFQETKCQIISPMNRILKRNSFVSIECCIPNAIAVCLIIDGKTNVCDDYKNSILNTTVKIGEKEFKIGAKYEQTSLFKTLIQYKVE